MISRFLVAAYAGTTTGAVQGLRAVLRFAAIATSPCSTWSADAVIDGSWGHTLLAHSRVGPSKCPRDDYLLQCSR